MPALFFLPYDLDRWPSDPQNKSVSRNHHVCVCAKFSDPRCIGFSRYRVEKQANKQTNTQMPTHATAVSMGNYYVQIILATKKHNCPLHKISSVYYLYWGHRWHKRRLAWDKTFHWNSNQFTTSIWNLLDLQCTRQAWLWSPFIHCTATVTRNLSQVSINIYMQPVRSSPANSISRMAKCRSEQNVLLNT